MVGYFINPLALRLDLSGDPSFSELLTRARETTLERVRPRRRPVRDGRARDDPERDLSQTPVFQAMIVFHNPAWQTERPEVRAARASTATEIVHEKGWSKFDLLLGMSERTNGPQHDLGVQHRAVRAATIERMIEPLPSARRERRRRSGPADLAAVDALDDERGKVLVDWSETPAADPRDDQHDQGTVRRAGRADAGRGRGRLRGRQLSFDELNRRANRLAQRLQAARRRSRDVRRRS